MKGRYFGNLFLCFVIVIGVSACQKYNGEYVQWGDTAKSVDIDKLERNDIPYKIKDNKVYIPEDAFDKATYCCT
ncbi:hypothetical protein KFD70_25660 [Bacillus pfraonensis]|uniref:hypothetical protein n=1 Tax=Bacillus TaxID=1386 RepID=UPI003012BB61